MSSLSQESVQPSLQSNPETTPRVLSGRDSVGVNDTSARALQGSLGDISSAKAEGGSGTKPPNETPVIPVAPSGKTDYEKQEQSIKDGISSIDSKRADLAAQGTQLDVQEKNLKAKLEAQEKEGKERSKEAKNALDEIVKSAQEGPGKRHTEALSDTIKSLPDKLTTRDVEDLKERARWDAAKASVGDKDFSSMAQTEKDVVLERVKKMKENATPNPESALWDAAKKASGLSPDTKWTDMTTAEQKLAQERFADEKVKAQTKDTNKPSDTPVSPKILAENKPSVPAPAPAPTEKSGVLKGAAPVPAPVRSPSRTPGLDNPSEASQFVPVETPGSEKKENQSGVSKYTFLDGDKKTEEEEGWDGVGFTGNGKAFIQGNKLIYVDNFSHSPNKPWVNFEVSKKGELTYIGYNKDMLSIAPSDAEIRERIKMMNDNGLNVTWNGDRK